MSRPRQRILPVFLPMQGCPGDCIYCDQRAISGQQALPPLQQLAAELAALPADAGTELAFYGGTFTWLPQDTQLQYLQLAEQAKSHGRIGSVRISTRPDAVDEAICAFLRQHGVATVELGVQSLDDEVLQASQRGYTAEQALAGCTAVRQAGLTLGVQLMTGLPADAPQKSLSSLKAALAAGAEQLRIYPTLVLKDTALAASYLRGDFQPQDLQEAVQLCADMLAHCICHDLVMLRMGLNPSAELEQALLAGPYHPAFGGLVKEELRRRQIAHLLQNLPADQAADLRFNRHELPLVFGQHNLHRAALQQQFPLLRLVPRDELPRGEMQLTWAAGQKCSSEQQFCADFCAD